MSTAHCPIQPKDRTAEGTVERFVTAAQLLADSGARSPTLIVPAGVTFALPLTLSVQSNTADSLARYVAYPEMTLPEQGQLGHRQIITENTTSAGLQGADCQPVWGTAVSHHLVAIHLRRGHATARLATPDMVPGLLDLTEDDRPGLRVWIAEAKHDWHQDELSSGSTVSSITLMPLHALAGEAADRRLAAGRAQIRDLAGDREDEPRAAALANAADGEDLLLRARRTCLEAVVTCAGAGQDLNALLERSRQDPLATRAQETICLPPVPALAQIDRQPQRNLDHLFKPAFASCDENPGVQASLFGLMVQAGFTPGRTRIP